MNAYREQVMLALRAMTMPSRTRYTWFGRRSRTIGDPEQLVAELTSVLYRSFYSQGAPLPVTAHLQRYAPADPPFVERLSRANRGRGGWQHDWRVVYADASATVVERAGLRVSVQTGDCSPEVRPGETVSVPRPKEDRAAAPGFYVAIGDATRRAPQTAPVELRVYFNPTAPGAVRLMATATDLLNEAAIPFQLKVVNNPAAFVRCDAAVLYLDPGHFEPAQPALRVIVSACAPGLRPEVPAFAKELAPGVAVAEHLGRLGPSFGWSRCRILAEATAAARGRTALTDRLDAVARHFAYHGLDIDAPYLAPGSHDCYEL